MSDRGSGSTGGAASLFGAGIVTPVEWVDACDRWWSGQQPADLVVRGLGADVVTPWPGRPAGWLSERTMQNRHGRLDFLLVVRAMTRLLPMPTPIPVWGFGHLYRLHGAALYHTGEQAAERAMRRSEPFWAEAAPGWKSTRLAPPADPLVQPVGLEPTVADGQRAAVRAARLMAHTGPRTPWSETKAIVLPSGDQVGNPSWPRAGSTASALSRRHS